MALRAAAARAGLMAGLGATLGTTVAACADDNKYFDPDALERGAKALREIQSSPYAKKVRWGRREPGWAPHWSLPQQHAAAAAAASPPAATVSPPLSPPRPVLACAGV